MPFAVELKHNLIKKLKQTNSFTFAWIKKLFWLAQAIESLFNYENCAGALSLKLFVPSMLPKSANFSLHIYIRKQPSKQATNSNINRLHMIAAHP